MKVVQVIYSYLVSRSDFQILKAPETASRDRRFAYRVYVGLLMNVLRLSGYKVGDNAPVEGIKLNGNKMAKSLIDDNDVKSVVLKYSSESSRYDSVLPVMYAKITDSEAFKDYKKIKSPTIVDDITFWKTVIYTIISNDADYLMAARGDEEFTTLGFRRGISDFINTIADFSESAYLLHQARTTLKASMDKAYDMYLRLLTLPIALVRLEEERIENSKHKYLPSPADLNPNMKFVGNTFVKRLEENRDIQDYLRANSAVWTDDYLTVGNLLKLITDSPCYSEYMDDPTRSEDADWRLWRDLFAQVVFPSDELSNFFESKSIFWNDDLSIIGTFVLKTMRQIAVADAGDDVCLLPEFKDEEDSRFGLELFNYVVENEDTYRGYINRYVNTDRWEADRIALMDIIVLMTAIAEIINYPAIPAVVSINEYVEIAKYYSTAKSGKFVNGILSSVVNYLKSENIIHIDK